MRCYHFCNFYYSPIQHGIQSAHAQMEMFVKYQEDSPCRDQLFDWAINHKTMICLNAGCNQQIQEWYDFLLANSNNYPWSGFREEVGSVSHAKTLTNVALVLPERIYNASLTHDELEDIRFVIGDDVSDTKVLFRDPGMFGKAHSFPFTHFEVQLIHKLRQCRLV